MTLGDLVVSYLFVALPLNFLIFSWIGLAVGHFCRNNAGMGWLSGLVFGPIGCVLAVCLTDNRRKCPQCATICDKQARICSRCLAVLPPVPFWQDGKLCYPPSDQASSPPSKP